LHSEQIQNTLLYRIKQGLKQGWATLLALRATLETSKVSAGQYVSMLADFKVVFAIKQVFS